MKVEVISKPLALDVYGFSEKSNGRAAHEVLFPLMNKMWQVVKGNKLANKGLNVWVYEPNGMMFAGVELNDLPDIVLGLERKQITVEKYAYYKHIGSYSLIRQAGAGMRQELEKMKLTVGSAYIEIYGHWDSDESKLETVLIMSLA